MSRLPSVRAAARAAAACAAAATAACASGRAASTGAASPAVSDPAAGQITQTTTLVTGTGSYSVAATNEGPGSADRALPAAPDSAFYALLEAYQGVGITPNTIVSGTRTVGVRDGRFRVSLGKRRLSEFLSCGSDASGQPLADQYRVIMTALSRVSPGASGGSVVSTQVSATAQSLAQSTDPVRCVSTGRLEGAINALAAVRSAR